jgi:hypothetical protein
MPRLKHTRIDGYASRLPLPSLLLAGSRAKLSRACACDGGKEKRKMSKRDDAIALLLTYYPLNAVTPNKGTMEMAMIFNMYRLLMANVYGPADMCHLGGLSLADARPCRLFQTP